MIETTIGKLPVRLHDDIRQMPYLLKAEFHHHLFLEREIGNDNDSQSSIARCLRYLEAGQLEDLRTALENQYLTYETVKTDTVHLANAYYSLLMEVNGVKIIPFVESERDRILAQLSENGLTSEMIRETVESVKKNSTLNWQHTSRRAIA